MKNIKKDIPSILGLIGVASLTYITSGIVSPASFALIGTLSSGIVSNLLLKLSPDKMKQWFEDTHPSDLNHSIKKLFIQSVEEALENINVLYSESNATPDEKKQAKQIIRQLQREIPGKLSYFMRIKIDESEINRFLKADAEESEIIHYITDGLENSSLSKSFKDFLVLHLKPQIQLCFGEGLKDPANNNAWIAFQRMLMENIQDSIDRIEAGQQEIKENIEHIKGGTGLTGRQLQEISELKNLLKNKKQIKLRIDESISSSLEAIEQKENELIRITTHTGITVNQLKLLTEKIHRQNRRNHFITVSFTVVLCIAAIYAVYKTISQPFTTTIQVYGWEGEQHNPLEGKGTIALMFEDKKERAEINRAGEAVFKKINPEYNNQKVRIYLEDIGHEPFYLVDSTILIKKNKISKIPVHLKGLEKFEGYVYDENGFGIPDVLVSLAELNASTDAKGYFRISIPLDKQKRHQSIEITKNGYTPYRNSSLPMTDDVFERVLIKN